MEASVKKIINEKNWSEVFIFLVSADIVSFVQVVYLVSLVKERRYRLEEEKRVDIRFLSLARNKRRCFLISVCCSK